MGVSMISPEGFAISPRIPANCRNCWELPRAPESAMMKRELKSFFSNPLTTRSSSSSSSRNISSLVEAGEIIQPLGERILGRTTLEDVIDPFTNQVLVAANSLIDEETVELIDNSGIESIRMRSCLTCESQQGLCVKCYGRNLATNDWVEVGEPVGVIAAQSIGEPGTQLTMRTFHIGGTASRVVEQTTLSTKKGGIVKYSGLRTRPFWY